jgi:UDP-N-acetylmuramoylalanine--D-glutamate ligase
LAAARALLALDAKVKVTESTTSEVIEQRAARLRAEGAEVETGGHDLETLDGDLAVLSPGIPPRAPVVRSLLTNGVEIISEVELAFRVARCDFIAVTGTNGKTTTTSLLGAMLAESGRPSVAAGNIGLPLVEAALQIPPGGVIAAEVSSFQLASITSFRPRVAVLLNIAQDHIDWHGGFDSYIEAKARLVEFQEEGDVFLPNVSDELAAGVARRARARVVPFSPFEAPAEGIGFEGGELFWRGERVIGEADLTLRGVAGLTDVAAAAGAALEYGIERSAVVRALRGFSPLAHRLQIVAEARGISFIDDSKATNPHATLAAVRGLSDVVLIAGGRSKGIDLGVLADTVPPVRSVVVMGEAADELEGVFAPLVKVRRVASMEDAVRVAAAEAVDRGSVLLSPGCASLDMYESYAQRGEAFAAAVRTLLRSEQAEDTVDGDA